MSSGLEPYEPLNVLKQVAEDIWIVDGPIIRFGPWPIRSPFTTRMTVIRLSDGTLWLHSPVELDDALADAVTALGKVRFLIAPNSLHYWWVGDWKERFPDAQLYAVDRLRTHAKRPLPEFHGLTSIAPAEWSGQIDQLLVEDGWFAEAVFFHRASRTLILADLIENFELPRVRNWAYRLLLRLGGVADPDGSMPRDMRFMFRRHRADLKAAVERMIGWNPENVILAHGRWYPESGAAELRRAFRWLLG